MTVKNGTILSTIEQGLPLKGVFIMDVHGHLGHVRNRHTPFNDAKSVIRIMDRIGIDKVCLSGMASLRSDYRFGNDLIGEALKNYPDRLIGYAVVNPNYPEKDIIEELDRCFNKLGMKAIKIHPVYHGCPVDSSNYHPIFEYASARGCPILSHTWEGESEDDPSLFDKLSRDYPRVNFILGHSGARPRGVEKCIKLARKRDNIYLDLACSLLMYFGVVENFVKQVGADKILYGSDFVFHDPRPHLGKIAYARISDRDKVKILGLNAARIFGIDVKKRK
jgi:predicted TIM-barrel fold metal-dependent hydrolase